LWNIYNIFKLRWFVNEYQQFCSNFLKTVILPEYLHSIESENDEYEEYFDNTSMLQDIEEEKI